MVIDEYGNRRFYGIYRGVVFSNKDPLEKGRLRLRVPQVLADQITEWAWPLIPPEHLDRVPVVSEQVWVSFEGGDPSFPVCIYTTHPTDGATGPAGPAGPAGATGPTGPAGPEHYRGYIFDV